MTMLGKFSVYNVKFQPSDQSIIEVIDTRRYQCSHLDTN